MWDESFQTKATGLNKEVLICPFMSLPTHFFLKINKQPNALLGEPQPYRAHATHRSLLLPSKAPLPRGEMQHICPATLTLVQPFPFHTHTGDITCHLI